TVRVGIVGHDGGRGWESGRPVERRRGKGDAQSAAACAGPAGGTPGREAGERGRDESNRRLGCWGGVGSECGKGRRERRRGGEQGDAAGLQWRRRVAPRVSQRSHSHLTTLIHTRGECCKDTHTAGGERQRGRRAAAAAQQTVASQAQKKKKFTRRRS